MEKKKKKKKKTKINIIKEINQNLNNDEINIIIKSNKLNNELKELIDYIKRYNHNKVLVYKGYESFMIDYNDIMLFYSENRNNYCKTSNNEIYQIKSKLYELENLKDFIRISKKCIVNINFIKCFNTSQTGKIIVVLYDGTEENVSRRRIRNVLNFLDDRSI